MEKEFLTALWNFIKKFMVNIFKKVKIMKNKKLYEKKLNQFNEAVEFLKAAEESCRVAKGVKEAARVAMEIVRFAIETLKSCQTKDENTETYNALELKKETWMKAWIADKVAEGDEPPDWKIREDAYKAWKDTEGADENEIRRARWRKQESEKQWEETWQKVKRVIQMAKDTKNRCEEAWMRAEENEEVKEAWRQAWKKTSLLNEPIDLPGFTKLSEEATEIHKKASMRVQEAEKVLRGARTKTDIAKKFLGLAEKALN